MGFLGGVFFFFFLGGGVCSFLFWGVFFLGVFLDEY